MTDELQQKVERAVKLIQSAGADGKTVEVAYSGGTDSDVILNLTRMAVIKYQAIYKNTTIDPPGTIKHVKEVVGGNNPPKDDVLRIYGKEWIPEYVSAFLLQGAERV